MLSDVSSPVVEALLPAPDPVACCERLAGLPYRIFLDSAARGTRLGRYSFLTADPVAVVRSKGARTERLDLETGVVHAETGGALEVVRGLLAPHRVPLVPDLPPFQGGIAGYIAYEWGLTLERLPAPRYDDLALFDTVLGLYDWVLAWDHLAARAWLISTGLHPTAHRPRGGDPGAAEPGPEARRRRADERAAFVRRRLDAGPLPSPPQARGAATVPDRAPSFLVERGWWDSHLPLRSSFTRAGYLEAVARVREYILAGDIFQANLSQRFEAPLDESPWTFYCRLREANPAPFAAYLELPDASVMSASPERFLCVDAAGRVETRPIKGTRPRGLGPEHDAALGQALTESAKDRAENLMIVDLMRNDLSRVCAPGTVRVSALFALERYATVHHLVSTVVGALPAGTDALDLFRAAFPGGSITGAPKLRAMEVIAEFEPSQRGVYCGSIGYFSLSGDLDTNIAIRTAVAREGRVYFSAGGGIVTDSDPEQEYRETLDKARALIDVLATRA